MSFRRFGTGFRPRRRSRARSTRFGIEESHLRETLRANLRLRAYLEQRFTVVAPSDEEIAAYYREHPDGFTRGGRVPPLDEVRDDVVQTLAFDRRQTMVDEWIAGLRRRAADHRRVSVAGQGQRCRSATRSTIRRTADLQQVECGVADHRPDDRPPPQIDDAPERAEQRCRDHGVAPCSACPAPKASAGDDHSHRRAAEPALEPPQDECALHLFADATGDHHHDGEERGIAGVRSRFSSGLLLDGVQPRGDGLHARRTASRDDEAPMVSGSRRPELPAPWPAAEEHVRGPLAVCLQEQQYQVR